MIRILFLVAIVFFAMSATHCSKDNEPVSPDPQNDTSDDGTMGDDGSEKTVTLTFEMTNFTDGSFDKYTIYLSDAEGAILSEASLEDNATTSVSATVMEGKRVDASLVRDFDLVSYRLVLVETYQDVETASYELRRDPAEAINNASILLENTGCTLIMNPYDPEVTFNATSNEATAAMEFRGIRDKFLQFECQDAGNPRYAFVQDVTDGASYTFDYNSLPEADQSVTVTFPPNVSLGYSEYGYKNYPEKREEHFVQNPILEAVTSHSYQTPSGFFDLYKAIANITFEDNTRLITQKFSETPATSFERPDLDATIQSATLDNFEATTSGTHVAHNVYYSYTDASGLFQIQYNVEGRASATINQENRRLFDAIFSGDAAVNSELLSSGSLTLYRYNYLNSYEELLQERLGSKPINERVYEAGDMYQTMLFRE